MTPVVSPALQGVVAATQDVKQCTIAMVTKLSGA